MAARVSVAVLYNQIGEEEYERMLRKARRDPDLQVDAGGDISTAREQISRLVGALKTAGFRAYGINIQDRFEDLYKALTRRRPDVVFNLVEFFNDDPRQEFMVASLYELLRVPYTGASPLTLALCQRKGRAKQMLLARGLRTPKFRVMQKGNFRRRHGLHYPLIVKPVREDASVGIDQASVVESFEQLEQRVVYVWKEFDQGALVEEYIAGRELHVPILGNFPPRALPITEMDFSAVPGERHNILSYAAKWDPRNVVYQNMKVQCPADLPARTAARVRSVALAAYHALDGRDYARVDIRLDKRNRVYVLEVNPNPDLSEQDVFMQSAHKAGLDTTAILRKLVELALRRTPANTQSVIRDPSSTVCTLTSPHTALPGNCLLHAIEGAGGTSASRYVLIA
jgi:D-alanine-D-alanine ligase